MGRKKNRKRKTNSSKNNNGLDFGSLFKNLPDLGAMGGMPGMGQPATPKLEKGILKKYNNGGVDLLFNNKFYIDLSIRVDVMEGLNVIPVVKKLGLPETTYHLPTLSLFYIYRIPLVLAQMAKESKEGFYLDNQFKDSNVAKVCNDSKTGVNEKSNLQDQQVLKDLLYFKWTDLEEGDIIISSNYEEQNASKLHLKIMKSVLINNFNLPSICDVDLLLDTLLKYSIDTVVISEGLEDDKKKEIEAAELKYNKLFNEILVTKKIIEEELVKDADTE